MDFEGLLDEVEGVIGGSSATRKPSYSSATHSSPPSTNAPAASWTASKARNSSRDDIDDLLDMIGDDSSEPAAVHPCNRSAQSRDASSSSSARKDEFQTGGKKNICANLRCNECDFTVVQFLGKKWNASADYMFFRENVPNEAKLRVKMDAAPGVVAYACQCKWLSIDVQTRVDSCRVKWSCAGH